MDSSPDGSSTGSDDGSDREAEDTQRFISEETLSVIGDCLGGGGDTNSRARLDSLLMPPPTTPARAAPNVPAILPCSPGLGLKETVEEYLVSTPVTGQDMKGYSKADQEEEEEELDLTGIDEDEIDSYLMSTAEIENKTKMWMTVNRDFLLEQEEKIKKEKELREEMIKKGIDPDKKRKNYKKRNKQNLQCNGTALEAIEKIVQEKKMSTKINYDVLKNLNMGLSPNKVEKKEEVKSCETEKEEMVVSNSFSAGQKRVSASSGVQTGKRLRFSTNRSRLGIQAQPEKVRELKSKPSPPDID